MALQWLRGAPRTRGWRGELTSIKARNGWLVYGVDINSGREGQSMAQQSTVKGKANGAGEEAAPAVAPAVEEVAAPIDGAAAPVAGVQQPKPAKPSLAERRQNPDAIRRVFENGEYPYKSKDQPHDL